MKINKRNIKQLLQMCAFDPNKDGLLKIISESIEETPDYGVMRAIELLTEYRQIGNPEELFLAIQLIILAILAQAPDEPISSKK